ncbi:MAG: hypothetical protein AVDCRST_MAG12-214, partial [uncultured Rubrobacteraceae bacterium]
AHTRYEPTTHRGSAPPRLRDRGRRFPTSAESPPDRHEGRL